MPQPRQLFPRCRVAKLRLVAEGEQGLLAARRRAALCDIEDLVAGEIGAAELLWGLGEHAVVTNVAAELGERDEDLLGEADHAPMPGVPQGRRQRHQLGEGRPFAEGANALVRNACVRSWGRHLGQLLGMSLTS